MRREVAEQGGQGKEGEQDGPKGGKGGPKGGKGGPKGGKGEPRVTSITVNRELNS